jgi:hypothetical protein
MKLSEIRPLKESVTPIHILMILNEIVAAGKATNMVHFNVLQQMVQLFKFGNNHSPRNANGYPSSKEQLDDLRGLKPEEQVSLAVWFLLRLQEEEQSDNVKKYCNPQQELADWVMYVNKKQD